MTTRRFSPGAPAPARGDLEVQGAAGGGDAAELADAEWLRDTYDTGIDRAHKIERTRRDCS